VVVEDVVDSDSRNEALDVGMRTTVIAEVDESRERTQAIVVRAVRAPHGRTRNGPRRRLRGPF